MSSDFSLVDVAGWEWDLHGVYAAYLGYFQSYNIPWYDRSWGHLFASFEAFLGFSWPAVVITDARTGRGHVVTRSSTVQAFVRMIKTRFGETMPLGTDHMTPITPYEHSQRQLRNINDMAIYKKVHGTLPAAQLTALKSRVKHGNPKELAQLWHRREKTFLALDFEWSEKSLVVLEMGYATIRSAHLDASGVWPPVPASNYRKGHFIVQDHVDKIHNRITPTFPWDYAWGDSQLVSKAKIADILQALLTSLASPDSESIPNSLVLISHTPQHIQERLQDLKVKLPSNVLIVDIAHYERQLFNARNPTAARSPHQTLSLPNMLLSQNIPVLAPYNNSGNDAFYTLLIFQYLIDPEGTQVPPPKVAKRDGMPVVIPGTMPHLNGMVNGNGNSKNSKRLSIGTDKELGFATAAAGVVSAGAHRGSFGAQNGWQTRMSMFNGSMPSFSNTGGVHGAGSAEGGGRASPSASGSAPVIARGRSSANLTNHGILPSSHPTSSAAIPTAADGAGRERRSGSTARSGLGAGGRGGEQGANSGGSGASSPRLPPERLLHQSSAPTPSRPRVQGSNQSHQTLPSQARSNTSPVRPTLGHRRQDSEDDFMPPQAPFAREALRNSAKSRSYEDKDLNGTHRSTRSAPTSYTRQNSTNNNNGGSGASTPTSTTSMQPSIMVTEHGSREESGSSASGKGSLNGVGKGRPPTVVSLNEPPRPQSDMVTKTRKDSHGSSSNFFANTIKRFSIKP